jgi:hypothetical protein
MRTPHLWCDVTAMSHVSETSHVTEIAVANNCWQCQQSVALPTADGIANSRWHCQHLLASQVIWISIYSPLSSRRKSSCFQHRNSQLNSSISVPCIKHCKLNSRVSRQQPCSIAKTANITGSRILLSTSVSNKLDNQTL